MVDPFANVRSLDPAELAAIPSFDVAGAAVQQPFDDVSQFNPVDDPEVNTNLALKDDLSFARRPVRRLMIDYRPNMNAFKHVERLPKEGESIHGIISGKYALWDLVPGLIARVGRRVTDLHIMTLSYGRQNAEELLSLLDEGRIQRTSLLVSYFFKAQNRTLYDSLVPPLRERGHRVIAMRTHCKLLLVKFAGGGCYVIESSANLRSCKNIEQFVFTRCRRLYRWHRDWMESELLRFAEESDDGERAEQRGPDAA